MQIYSNLFNAFIFLNLCKVLILLTFYREIEGLWILGFWIVVVPHSPLILNQKQSKPTNIQYLVGFLFSVVFNFFNNS